MKFKPGDKVRRINYDNCNLNGVSLKIGDESIVIEVDNNMVYTQGGLSNDPQNLELVKEEKMNTNVGSYMPPMEKETTGKALGLAVKNLVDSGVDNIKIKVDNYVVTIKKEVK